jgi:hypothetical protein
VMASTTAPSAIPSNMCSSVAMATDKLLPLVEPNRHLLASAVAPWICQGCVQRLMRDVHDLVNPDLSKCAHSSPTLKLSSAPLTPSKEPAPGTAASRTPPAPSR